VYSAIRRFSGNIIRQHVFNRSVRTEICFQFSVPVTYRAHNLLNILGTSIMFFYEEISFKWVVALLLLMEVHVACYCLYHVSYFVIFLFQLSNAFLQGIL
jgi:hypothetical protein